MKDVEALPATGHRIAIDARSLSVPPTGVGHFLLAAINLWSERSPATKFILLSHKPMHSDVRSLLSPKALLAVNFLHSPSRCFKSNGSWWLLTHFAKLVERAGASVAWCPMGISPLSAWGRCIVLLTVHDLVYKRHPATMPRPARIAHYFFGDASIRRADVLWAVSRFTAREIEEQVPRRKSKQISIGSGLNARRSHLSSTLCRQWQEAPRLDRGRKDILSVATVEPRKNLGFLISLMPRLSTLGFRLLLVGPVGWGRTDVHETSRRQECKAGSIEQLGYVSSEELERLYRSAEMLVSTSLYEGFGLPIIEAMAAGCPVVAGNHSAHPEVVGPGGILVDGWEADAWIHAIQAASLNRVSLSMLAANWAHSQFGQSGCGSMSRAVSGVERALRDIGDRQV